MAFRISCRKSTRIFLACCLVAWASLARAGAADQDRDGSFTTVTTHIEADAWQFLRIERPAPLPPLQPVVADPAGDKTYAKDINMAGLIVYKQFVDSQHRVHSRRKGLVEFPFFFDHYLVALYDGTDHYGYERRNAFGGYVTQSHLVLLDAPIVFTGVEARFDAPDNFYWEALNLPLSTTISHRIDGHSVSWTALNVPLICGFSYHGDSSSAHTRVLDIPLASLYEGHDSYNKGKKSDTHWTLLHVPIFTLMEGDRHGSSSSFSLCDGPLFYLWKNRQDSHSASVQVLRLPILGPLFSWKADSDGSHVGLFRDFF